MISRVILPGLVIITVAIVGLGGSCDSPTKTKPQPTIELISVTNTDILPGEIVTVVFTTTNADSILMYPGPVKIIMADTITHPVMLFAPNTLRFVAVNSEGIDTLVIEVTMSAATAVINSFTVSEAVIALGDSTQLSWSVSMADSVVINNGVGKLADLNGSLWVYPTTTTTYQAIAYNIGSDVASVQVTVEAFSDIKATSTYFKGEMGSSVFEPPLGFWIETTANNTATKLWYDIEIIEGDGSLSHGSILSGGAQPTYNFSGSLGYAHLRAKVAGVDSVDVYLRTSILTNGAVWQGQYIKHDDPYAWVETYNGTPAAIGIDPVQPLLYADYEALLGVVFIVIDANGNNLPGATEQLLGVIVNTKFDKVLPGGVGIDSTYQKMVDAFGVFDTTYVDIVAPAADVYIYYSQGLTFFTNPADSIISEIHITDPVLPASPSKRYRPNRYTNRVD